MSLLVLPACSSLLDVDESTQISEETLDDPQAAPVVVESALADFGCAFAEFIVVGGTIGDELKDAQLAAVFFDVDRRTVTDRSGIHELLCENAVSGLFSNLTRARFSADNAVRILAGSTEQVVPNLAASRATVSALAGYSRLLLGEAHCSAGDLVLSEGGELMPGPEVTSQQLFAQAEERFTAALDQASAASSEELLNLARIGRARARLNQGDGGGAVQDASQVPPGFVFTLPFSASSFRSSNRVFTANIEDERLTIEEDYRNLTFEGVPDPRVSVVDEGRASNLDRVTELFTQTKYLDREAPIPLARYEEAQLIVAEVELGSTAVDVINQLHAAAGLPPFQPADVGDDVEILGHVYAERQRELFLESQHFFDKLRFREKAAGLGVTEAELTANVTPKLPVSPPPGAVSPKGGTFGELACLPLPRVERENNPNL